MEIADFPTFPFNTAHFFFLCTFWSSAFSSLHIYDSKFSWWLPLPVFPSVPEGSIEIFSKNYEEKWFLTRTFIYNKLLGLFFAWRFSFFSVIESPWKVCCFLLGCGFLTTFWKLFCLDFLSLLDLVWVTLLSRQIYLYRI